MIGQTIAQYEIVEKLGEGGMGIVYKARDSRLDRFVALKVLPPECVADPDRKRRFVQEAKAASALNHPNIITIHDIISAEGFDFIVMEFVAGKPLDHVIGRAPKGLEPTLDYGIQIADALVKAHAAGIVHRDLKPANVMLTPDGLVKLLDFGLAKLLRPDPGEGPTMTMTGGNVVAGTLSYMSPEQLRGEGVDERTDIWAVGAVLYELATGRRPFEAKLATALAADIQTKPPVLPRQLEPEIPPRFEEVILKCLEKDPERRYQSAKELRVDLARLREPSAVTVAPPAPRGLTWGAFRIGAAAVAAVLAVVFIVWLRPQAPSPTLNIRPVTSLVGMEWGATFSPDASLMAYAHNRYGHMDVFVVPTSGGGDPVRVTNNPADELTPRWSPDGRHLVFISDRGLGASVYLTSPLGGPERRLADTHLPYLEHSSQVLTALGAQPWSADATELLFSRLEPTGAIAIWKINLETGSETQLTRPGPGVQDLYASWSCDDARIAFARREQGQEGLWMLDTRNGETERLLADANVAVGVAWLPGCERLVFVSREGGPRNLWEIDVRSRAVSRLTSGTGSTLLPVVSAGGAIAYTEYTHQVDLYWGPVDQPQDRHQRLTANTRNNFGGRVSPDGRYVAYHSDRSGNYDLWLHDRESGTDRNLTEHPSQDIMGDWSPDGREIVFLSNREQALQVWVLELESSRVRRVSALSRAMPAEPHFSGPRWSSDGRAIGFVAGGEQEQTLWAVDPRGGPERAILTSVVGFDWYRDSRQVVYTRRASDGSGVLEMHVVDLESGAERLLLRGPTAELVASRDGRHLAFVQAASHFDMQVQVLDLAPPTAPGELPRALGDPRQVTRGESAFHVHNGGWSPDGTAILYSRDFDNGDVFVLERR
jgi:Tol biopolymer transport system component/predicted Ser/Thr protein kinase